MIVAGPEGFQKNQYRKFNIRSADLTPGDDFAMMREVLERRFKRLMTEAPRVPAEMDGCRGGLSLMGRLAVHCGQVAAYLRRAASAAKDIDSEDDGCRSSESPWPDLVVIDGGRGQLSAAQATLAALGLTDVPLVAVAKGPERDAGRETFFVPGREPFKLKPRDPVLYFVQRLRDEAHRFAIGSHRARRKKDIRESGLQEIAGVGPARKRALLQHFGTAQGDRARVTRRSGEGRRRQRRDGEEDLRLLPRAGRVSERAPAPCTITQRRPGRTRREDFLAALAFDHGDVVLALQLEPELRPIAESSGRADRRVGGDRPPAVENVGNASGRDADVERESDWR